LSKEGNTDRGALDGALGAQERGHRDSLGAFGIPQDRIGESAESNQTPLAGDLPPGSRSPERSARPLPDRQAGSHAGDFGGASGRIPEAVPKSLLVRAAIGFLKVYKLVLSPLLPRACRFVPTCSEYARDAMERYGVARGTVLALKRLCRCQPFSAGGFDPVR
jgi:uncharacterized protein